MGEGCGVCVILQVAGESICSWAFLGYMGCFGGREVYYKGSKAGGREANSSTVGAPIILMHNPHKTTWIISISGSRINHFFSSSDVTHHATSFFFQRNHPQHPQPGYATTRRTPSHPHHAIHALPATILGITWHLECSYQTELIA